MPSSPNRYYDVDAILAEEELVPCSTLFDFSYLAHLDPDRVLGDDDDDDKAHYLPEGSRIKVPMWAVQKWATLGYVRLALPRHYGRKARERLQADPSEVDLRKKNERFFLAGRMLVHLIEESSKKVAKAIQSNQNRGQRRRNAQILALEQVLKEAVELRKTLLSTYTGDRLRHTMDWSLSSVGDDVTGYTSRLTEMERRLFAAGASSALNHTGWKTYGNRGLLVLHGRNNNPSTTADSSSGGKSDAGATTGRQGRGDDNEQGDGDHQHRHKRPRH